MANSNPTKKRRPRHADLTGQKFGYLVALEFVEYRYGHDGSWWKWLCTACNQVVIRPATRVKRNHRSCGCMMVKHGMARTRTPEYTAWLAMIDRCYDPTSQSYPRY